MAYSKTIVDIDEQDPILTQVGALLQMAKTRLVDGDFSFVTGSFAYNHYPWVWEKDHDIDIVFCDKGLPEELRAELVKRYAVTNDPAYKQDLSLYFRVTDGQMYNFITLDDFKFKVWFLATKLICRLCDSGGPLRDELLGSREARVAVFVACEETDAIHGTFLKEMNASASVTI